MKNTAVWMQQFTGKMQQGFGERLQFVGLQGSRARGEAAERSDIDVVVLLDTMDFADLAHYKALVAALPDRELLCGFVGGMDTLRAWDKAELVSFCLDTSAYYGSLEAVQNALTREDARRALHSGACALYHACAHNYVHAADPGVLRGLQKALFFVLRLKYYYETGCFTVRRSELLPLLRDDERALLTAGTDKLDTLSGLLLAWAAQAVAAYGQSPVSGGALPRPQAFAANTKESAT